MVVCIDGRYYIELKGSSPLDDAVTYKRSLIEILKMACLSEIFDSSVNEDFYYVLEVIELFQLSASQAEEV